MKGIKNKAMMELEKALEKLKEQGKLPKKNSAKKKKQTDKK